MRMLLSDIGNMEIANNAIESIITKSKSGQLIGELGHPDYSIDLVNASHIIKSIEVVGNEIYGDIEILDTPAGKTAKTLPNLKFGMRALGVNGVITEIITWDIIS